jgi:RNA polymerase sigma-70 factor (ECF subfamily)
VIRLANGDFGLAEESVQDAFTAALEQWPESGVPENARAWLFRTARNKAIDRLRRRSRFEAPFDEATEAGTADDEFPPGYSAASSSEPDDTLRLVFTCCHPALSLEAQVALTLRTLCGLSTEEIARAFLVDPEAMAQRLVRAKNKIKVARIPYVIPSVTTCRSASMPCSTSCTWSSGKATPRPREIPCCAASSRTKPSGSGGSSSGSCRSARSPRPSSP